MLRIEGRWGHSSGDVLGKLVLEVVTASSQGHILELRSSLLEIVVALRLNLSWGQSLSLRKLTAEGCHQSLLLLTLDLACSGKIHAVGILKIGGREIGTRGKGGRNPTSRDEAGNWDVVIAAGKSVAKVDAALVLQFLTSVKLELEVASGSQLVSRDLAVIKIGSWSESWNELTNLVGEVLDLVLDDQTRLQSIANCLLTIVESLVLWDLVLAFSELLLKGRSGILSNLVLKLGSLESQHFNLVLGKSAKLKMLRIGFFRNKFTWNSSSKLVLKIIVATSQSLTLELREEIALIVVALGGDLGRSEGILAWHKSSQIVT